MYIVYILSGLLGGILTGLSGLTVAMVLTPILCGICGWNSYDAVTLSLVANVPSALATCYTFYKNKNIDLKRGIPVSIVSFSGAILGSYLGYLFNMISENGVSYIVIIGNLLLAIKFFVPTKDNESIHTNNKTKKNRMILALVLAFLIGIECGFLGSAGGALMLMVLNLVLAMDTKLAVGTSSLIMTLVAMTGAISHIAMDATISPLPSLIVTLSCTIGAMLSAKFANAIKEKTLNYCTGFVLIFVSIVPLILSV